LVVRNSDEEQDRLKLVGTCHVFVPVSVPIKRKHISTTRIPEKKTSFIPIFSKHSDPMFKCLAKAILVPAVLLLGLVATVVATIHSLIS
jgi:hypothetical protein